MNLNSQSWAEEQNCPQYRLRVRTPSLSMCFLITLKQVNAEAIQYKRIKIAFSFRIQTLRLCVSFHPVEASKLEREKNINSISEEKKLFFITNLLWFCHNPNPNKFLGRISYANEVNYSVSLSSNYRFELSPLVLSKPSHSGGIGDLYNGSS